MEELIYVHTRSLLKMNMYIIDLEIGVMEDRAEQLSVFNVCVSDSAFAEGPLRYLISKVGAHEHAHIHPLHILFYEV